MPHNVDYTKISLKTPDEIKRMKNIGAIAAKILEDLTPYIIPGTTKNKLNDICRDLILNKYKVTVDREDLEGRDYEEYAVVSFAHNDVVFNGEADDMPLQEGDNLGIDISIKDEEGWCADTQRSWIIGEKCSDQVRSLVNTGNKAMWLAISMIKPGVAIQDIAGAVQDFVESQGFSMVRVASATGHSIGKVHADGWLIPYYRSSVNEGRILKKGMTFSVEPFICAGSGKAYRDNNVMNTALTKDGSRACYWEHIVAVTEDGCDILDLRSDEKIPDFCMNINQNH